VGFVIEKTTFFSTIMVWELPEEGMEFERVSILDHARGINQMVQTWSNLYSCADEEKVKVWCLSDMSLQKVLRPSCRVKCLWPAEYKADDYLKDLSLVSSSQEGEGVTVESGNLYGGLCDGSVVIWRLGTYC